MDLVKTLSPPETEEPMYGCQLFQHRTWMTIETFSDCTRSRSNSLTDSCDVTSSQIRNEHTPTCNLSTNPRKGILMGGHGMGQVTNWARRGEEGASRTGSYARFKASFPLFSGDFFFLLISPPLLLCSPTPRKTSSNSLSLNKVGLCVLCSSH